VYFFLPDDPGLELDDDPLLPLGAMPELEYFGFPPRNGNDAHPGDVFDALEAEVAGQNTRALYYALTGDELEETTTVTAGHRHTSEATHLDWITPLRVTFTNGLHSNAHAGVFVNQTALTNVGWAVFAVPSSHTSRAVLYSRVRAQAPATAGTNRLRVEIAIYTAVSGGSINLGSQIAAHQIVCPSTSPAAAKWYEGNPLELYGAPVNINGRQLVYVRFRAAVDTGDALLLEAALGWKPGA
jgi:hypothetical protein